MIVCQMAGRRLRRLLCSPLCGMQVRILRARLYCMLRSLPRSHPNVCSLCRLACRSFNCRHTAMLVMGINRASTRHVLRRSGTL